jgi:hypothetical protein
VSLPPEEPVAQVAQPVLPEPVAAPTSVRQSADDEASMSDQTRDLIFRFWSLSTSQRREIAFKLGLISEDDMTLSEAERYGRALIRAKELEQLQKLADEISLREVR